MQKLIVFTEEEFHNKLREFSKHFQEQSGKGYGCKLVSNETIEIITDIDSICGSLYLTWNKTFEINKGE